MSDKKTICIFCSSSSKVPAVYKEVARDAAAWCAGRGFDIVYGGSRNGLMGIFADEALARGALVTGVIPEYLKSKEVAHTGLSALHVTQTMHERQMKMSELADAFLILPGGLGTMAELFEAVTWKQLGLHDKPIVLLNIQGYWGDLLALMEKSADEGFLYSDWRHLFSVVEKPEELAGIAGFSGE